MVLALVVLLGFITVAFLEDAKDQIRYDAQFQEQEDLRAVAFSALDTTLAVLNVFQDVDGSIWGPEQGWGDPLDFAGYEPPNNLQVNVQIHDESGRFGIQDVEFDFLRIVFIELGFDIRDAEELADSLIDWMDEDDLSRLNGFDGEEYARLNPPYLPANDNIQSWDELALIPAFQENFWDEDGRPLPALKTFKDSFSLYNTDPVNINAAGPFVIRVLDELGIIEEENLNDYRAGPDLEPGNEDDRLLRDADTGGVFLDGGSGLAGTDSSLLEVSVEVKRGDSVFLLRSLVSWRGANTAAGETDEVEEETTDRAQSDEDTNENQRARGSAQTVAGNGAQLGYPFQIHWLAENRKN
jgi:general secretion pathway protein K